MVRLQNGFDVFKKVTILSSLALASSCSYKGYEPPETKPVPAPGQASSVTKIVQVAPSVATTLLGPNSLRSGQCAHFRYGFSTLDPNARNFLATNLSVGLPESWQLYKDSNCTKPFANDNSLTVEAPANNPTLIDIYLKTPNDASIPKGTITITDKTGVFRQISLDLSLKPALPQLKEARAYPRLDKLDSSNYLITAGDLVGSSETLDVQTGLSFGAGTLRNPRMFGVEHKLSASQTIVMIGGIDASPGADPKVKTPLSSIEKFDPVIRQWFSIGDLPEARSGHSVNELADGSLLICGGTTVSSPQPKLSSCLNWDIAKMKTVDSTAINMNKARSGHWMFQFPDQIFAIGGDANKKFSAEMYTPANRSWSSLADPAFGLDHFIGHQTSQGQIVLFGTSTKDEDKGKCKGLQLDTVKKIWSEIPGPGICRTSAQLISGPKNQLLLIGGQDDSTSSPSLTGNIETFDLTTSTWSNSGLSLTIPRRDFKAVFLRDTQELLIIGGTTKDLTATPSTETLPWFVFPTPSASPSPVAVAPPAT